MKTNSTELQKLQKYRTLRTILDEKSMRKWRNSKLKHIIRMNDNGHIPDLIWVFS